MPGHTKKDKRKTRKLNFVMTVKRKKTYSNIHIGSLNCHGLLDKLDCPNVIDLISKHDIFCVSETWIREEDQVYIPGFEYFPLNRKKCKGPLIVRNYSDYPPTPAPVRREGKGWAVCE